MPQTKRHAGRRSINYDNLLLSLVVIFVSFVSFLYLLTPDGLHEFGDARIEAETESSSNQVTAAAAPYVFLVADRTQRLALPGNTHNHSALVGGKSGILDATRKLQEFFTRPTRVTTPPRGSPPSVPVTQGVAMTRADLHRHVFLAKRLRPNTHSQSTDHAPDTFEVLTVLHLCSATSCVGPALTLSFARHTRSVSTNPMIIQALLFGHPALACLVAEELKQNGVRVPVHTTLLGTKAGRPALPGHESKALEGPVTETDSFRAVECANHGDVFLVGRSPLPANSLYANCSSDAACRYLSVGGNKSSTAAAARALAEQDPLLSTLMAASPGRLTDSSAVAGDSPVMTVPLDAVSFSTRRHARVSRLHSTAVDLVDAVDVDADDAVALVSYLSGLLDGLANASSRLVAPTNLMLPVHAATTWAVDTLSLVERLHAERQYSVFVISCPRPPSICPEGRAMRTEDLVRLRKDYAVEVLVARTTRPGAPRGHAIEPPAVLLLSRAFASLQELQAAAVASSHNVTDVRGTSASWQSIHDAADSFFAPPPPHGPHGQSHRPDSRVAQVDLDVEPQDVITAPRDIGVSKGVFKAGRWVARALLLALPVTICFFLLINVTKSWRRH